MTIKVYLEKTITDNYGNTANFHLLDIGDPVPNLEDGSLIFPDYKFKVYKDAAAYQAEAAPVDCFRPVLTFTITDAERKAETGTTLLEADIKAFLRKAVTSVLVDDVETNVFRGNAGEIDYIGVVVE